MRNLNNAFFFSFLTFQKPVVIIKSCLKNKASLEKALRFELQELKKKMNGSYKPYKIVKTKTCY